jgi:ribosomal protein S18 acetylase RimI-like enzyme
MASIRPVEPRDLAVICSHRRLMFAENGTAGAILDQMDPLFSDWLAPRLADGTYFGFLAEEDHAVVAGIGLFLIDWPPHPSHPTATQRGYILNVYVDPGFRGRGLSAQLMQLAENEFRSRGIEFIVLHASPMGRPVYEKLGWNDTSEMSRPLSKTPADSTHESCCS